MRNMPIFWFVGMALERRISRKIQGNPAFGAGRPLDGNEKNRIFSPLQSD